MKEKDRKEEHMSPISICSKTFRIILNLALKQTFKLSSYGSLEISYHYDSINNSYWKPIILL